MTIEQHNGVYVLRDDLLPGGTKSVFLGKILDPAKQTYVYASPVYGAFQIALGQYCSAHGKRAVIFCAKRKMPHKNSLAAKAAGAQVLQVPYGYLSNCQSKAKAYVDSIPGTQYIEFGGNYPVAVDAIAQRMREINARLGGEPDEIFCAVGSGTLLRGIIAGTTTAMITGVQVGAEYKEQLPCRVRILKHPLPFEKDSTAAAPFPSCSNYDLKAWEFCLKYRKGKKVLFWNVF